jgi:hypothetical protein
MKALAAVVTGLSLAACGLSPTPTQIGPPDPPGLSVPELAAGEVTQDGITLAATAEPAVVTVGEPIEVEAVLTHDRPDPLLVTGSGTGIVVFRVTRLGDGLTSGLPVSNGDCARHRLPAGEPTVVPFTKSGGFSPDDPNADFLDIYFSDPTLTLPPGIWRIDITTQGNLGAGCTGPQLDLALSLIVTVTD